MNLLHSVTAGFATTGQGAGPMMVTKRAGLFEKHGLMVETKLMGSAVKVVRGLMEGELQFGNMAAPAVLRAAFLEGADIVFLTGGINQQFLMGRPGITDRKQLAGGKMVFAADGGLNDFLVHFVLEELSRQGIGGIQMESGKVSDRERTERLARGDVDAEVITPPETAEAERKGCSILMDFSDYGFNFALGGLAARRSYIRDNEGVVRKFIKGYVEGMHRYRTDRDFTVQVQQEYSDIADRSIAEETFDTTCPGMPSVPYPVPEALGKALQVISRQIPAAAGANPRSFIDDRFIRELDESGFISSLYTS